MGRIAGHERGAGGGRRGERAHPVHQHAAPEDVGRRRSHLGHQGSPQAIIQGSPAVLPDQTIRHTIFPAGLLALDSAGTTLFIGSPPPQNAKATVSVAANGDMAVSGVRTMSPTDRSTSSTSTPTARSAGRRRRPSAPREPRSSGPTASVYAPFLGKAFFPDGTVRWTTDVMSFTAALGNNGVLYFPELGCGRRRCRDRRPALDGAHSRWTPDRTPPSMRSATSS